jgi:hypothetical protein
MRKKLPLVQKREKVAPVSEKLIAAAEDFLDKKAVLETNFSKGKPFKMRPPPVRHHIKNNFYPKI